MSGKTVAQAAYNFLVSNSAAATLRAMVQGGASNILEAGDLTEQVIQDAMDARRTAGALTKVLALSVQEGPEQPLGQQGGEYLGEQFFRVRIFDRDRGYTNIRDVTQALRRLMRALSLDLDAGCGTAHMASYFAGRTGHRWDRFNQVDYEAISFRCVVMYKEDW